MYARDTIDTKVYVAKPHHSGDGTYVVYHKIFLPNGEYELIPVSGEIYKTKEEAVVRAEELRRRIQNKLEG